MSTRAVIARWKPGTMSWEGRYHHLDGYPSGLGATLHEIHRTVFGGNVDAMTDLLIVEHPGGWSTINNADWTRPVRSYDHQDYACEQCGAHNLAHYRQYYRDTPRLLPPPAMADPQNPIFVLGHGAVGRPATPGPECSCHDLNGRLIDGVGDHWITEDGDDGGAEWAYLLDSIGITVFERRWNAGGHMVGMFGSGAGRNGRWIKRGLVHWTAKSVDWEQFEKVAAV